MDKLEILQLFLEEAFERTQDLGNQLIALEKDPSHEETIQVIFRCAHTLKGNSTTVYNTILDMDEDEVTLPNIDKIGKLTHALENLIMEVRDNGLELTSERIDLLFKAESALETLLGFVESGLDEEFDADELHISLKNAVPNNNEITVPPTKLKLQPESLIEEKKRETRYQLYLGIDETFKHAFLSLIYRDLEEKFSNITFNPSFDDLMDGLDFDEVFVTLEGEEDSTQVISFIESIDNVEKAIVLNSPSLVHDTTKPMEEAETQSLPTEPSSTNPTTTEMEKTPSITENEKANIIKRAEKITKDKAAVVNTTIKVSISRIDEVLKHVSNLVILKNKLLNFSNESNSEQSKEMKDTAEEISQTVEFLQESVMSIRMTPLDHLFDRFPKDVRNIAKEFDKKVNFSHIGGDTEIDKSLLDKLGDPLMHLIRNSVFHGIESEEERIAAGKDPIGNLTISAKHEQSMVVITVEDDGSGIDIDKVVAKAISRDLITEEKARVTSPNELANLIFHPGLSTVDTVNSVAGRGVGMDVVRSKIADDMKGQIEIVTAKGKGTKTIIRLPLTLAIINAMLTKIGGEVFAFSSSQVESVEEVKLDEIRYVANSEIYVLKERNIEIPIIRLDEYFGLQKESTNTKTLSLVILKSGIKTIGVTVDEFIGHEDIVLKNMGRYLGNIPGIGGCNVLGNGDISLMVDINSLLNSY